MSLSRPVYTCFDVVPAPKGAAVHVEAFSRGLGEALGPIDLVTVAPPGVSEPTSCERWPGVVHHQLPALGDNLIVRVLDFRARLGRWWDARRVPVAHVRSIYEGYPLAVNKASACERLVFEVNGVPSIELKYHYPEVADDRELQRKLLAQEQRCLAAADLLVTPSAVTAAHLAGRGVDPAKIRVIPNGVELGCFAYQAPTPWGEQRPIRLLYSGTLAAWQGVFTAVEALALLRRVLPARLTLAGPARARVRREILDRAQDLGVAGHLEVLEPLPQAALARLHHESDVILAPLVPNDRNLEQGACPLKVLEAMATGTPLVASDLPVVTELAERDQEALLVRPGSAKAIKDAVLRLAGDPALGPRLAHAARRRVERDFTWDLAQRRLVEGYRALLDGPQRLKKTEVPSAPGAASPEPPRGASPRRPG